MNSRPLIIRLLKIIGVTLLLAVAVFQTAAASVERSGKQDLIEILRRRSPVTDYQAAEAFHSDCRMNYEDAFLARVGFAITADRADPRQAANGVEIRRLTNILGDIEANCPTPIAPVFDASGALKVPPVIPSTTTATTIVLPTDPPGG